MKTGLLWLTVFVAAACLPGCAALGRRGPEDLSRPVRGEALPAEMLEEAAEQGGAEGRNIRRVAEAHGARVFALRVEEEVPEYRAWWNDQVFFVVSGEGIASVDGQRRLIAPGSVVVAPRRAKVIFVRGEEHRRAPLLMALVMVPYGSPPKGLRGALAPPEAAEQEVSVHPMP